jgi:hypothetical protein
MEMDTGDPFKLLKVACKALNDYDEINQRLFHMTLKYRRQLMHWNQKQ